MGLTYKEFSNPQKYFHKKMYERIFGPPEKSKKNKDVKRVKAKTQESVDQIESELEEE